MALIIIVVAIAGVMASIISFAIGVRIRGLKVSKIEEPNSNWIYLSP